MVTVVYCTRQSNPSHKEHLIKSFGHHKNIEVIEIINNGESLTKAYNRGLKQAKNDIVVFCHDDLIIETKQWGSKLLKLFNKNPEYGIIGVAGTKFMSSSGQWWENRRKMYGRVAHTHEGKTWLSSYSPDLAQEIEEVVIVDGVFFAIDKTKIKTGFNESVEGFHFYDVTFCFENYLKGTKIGVTTAIRINHKSIGQTNESWEANKLIFAEKYKEHLPVNIKRVLRKNEKLNVLVGCLSLKDNSPEETYVIELVKELVKEGCSVSITSNIDKKIGDSMKKLGVKLYTLQEPAGFKLGDGKWLLNTPNGPIPSQDKVLYKVTETKFDIIHMNQKPVVDHLVRLFPDIETVCTIHSVVQNMDEPVISNQIKKYIVINDEIKDVLIDGYGINSNLLETNPDQKKIMEVYKTILL